MPKLPGVNHQRAVRALQRAGFRIVSQGEHIVMSDGQRILSIPRHNPVNAGASFGFNNRQAEIDFGYGRCISP